MVEYKQSIIGHPNKETTKGNILIICSNVLKDKCIRVVEYGAESLYSWSLSKNLYYWTIFSIIGQRVAIINRKLLLLLLSVRVTHVFLKEPYFVSFFLPQVKI